MIDEYIRNLYLEESGTLQHRVQNDEDITNSQGKVVSHARGKHGKYFTINIVWNPQNNNDPPTITNESNEEVDVSGGMKNSIGVMKLIKAEDMQTDSQEIKLWRWAVELYDKMKKVCSRKY